MKRILPIGCTFVWRIHKNLGVNKPKTVLEIGLQELPHNTMIDCETFEYTKKTIASIKWHDFVTECSRKYAEFLKECGVI